MKRRKRRVQTALMILEIISKRLRAMYNHERHGWIALIGKRRQSLVVKEEKYSVCLHVDPIV